ncbi:predicted protein [Lichtheimia corymbifera JMRC:FSU:9682]|uniref:Uncharacterized protein n=1 Tax=Lichtheimia corymbifera JMRC:FSU:9682 TaxID=1263082 RepID=A0A068SB74_9FUNG|nr:predicted protein [Lichtheimia corymbifera JMRC:FSU:9682]CDH59633.1 predicted protein [Lichtheimia corymbifera JMRC:FSU:9682]
MRLSAIAIAIALVVAGGQAQSPNIKQDGVQVTQIQQNNNIGSARIAINKRYDDGNLHGDYEGDDEDGEEEDEGRRRGGRSRHRGSRGRSGHRGGSGGGIVEPTASKVGRIVDSAALGKLGGVTHSDPDV